jgi:WD40 repeat protein
MAAVNPEEMPMRRRLSLTILLAAFAAFATATGQQPDRKAPVPDRDAQAKIEAELKARYKDEYAKAQTDPEVAVGLADTLLVQAREAKGQGAARYVRLRLARDLAARAGNLATALQAAAELERSHDIEPGEERAAAVAAVVAGLKNAEAAKALVDPILDLAAQAVDADDYDLAGNLAEHAEQAARKAKSLPLVLNVQKYARGVSAAAKQFEAVKDFAARLRKAPEDEEANLRMGRYLCLLKGTWDRGLYLLAQGNDPELRSLAQRDLARPETAVEQAETGDAWWARAEKEEGQVKVHVRQRAVYWYEVALAGAGEEQRARLEERIAAVPRPRVRAPGWDYSGPPRELHTLRGHNNTVFGVDFLPDGRRVVSGDINGLGQVWDAASGKQVQALRGHGGMIWAVACDPKGRRIFTSSWDGTIKMWDARNGRELRRFPQNGRLADINGIAISPDGKQMLSGTDDSVMRLWDVETGKEIRQMRGHAGFVYGVAFSPDGKKALSGGNADGMLILWDLSNGQIIRRIQGVGGAIRTVAFSPDGKRALTAGENDVRMFDLSNGQEVRRFKGHTSNVNAVAFSPDGRRILSGANDNTIRLWDAGTGRQIHLFTGHTGAVFSLAFSPGGGRAVSGSGDNTVRVWGLPR